MDPNQTIGLTLFAIYIILLILFFLTTNLYRKAINLFFKIYFYRPGLKLIRLFRHYAIYHDNNDNRLVYRI
jgi:hypothetical protein